MFVLYTIRLKNIQISFWLFFFSPLVTSMSTGVYSQCVSLHKYNNQMFPLNRPINLFSENVLPAHWRRANGYNENFVSLNLKRCETVMFWRSILLCLTSIQHWDFRQENNNKWNKTKIYSYSCFPPFCIYFALHSNLIDKNYWF